MADLLWVTLLGQIALPVALVAALAASRCSSRLELWLQVLAAAAYLLLIAVVGVWLLIPYPVIWGYAGALAAAAGAAVVRLRQHPMAPRSGQRRARLAAHGALAAVSLLALSAALAGYAPPDADDLRLASPLRGGVYYAVNGGASILINPHMKALHRPELSAYRGQSYAVDLVKVDGWGRRAAGLMPPDPESYFIFGDPVVAPCAGRVADLLDGLPDRDPVELDRRPPAGNFVLLDCNDRHILLAHLQQGSVQVGAGERVRVGQRVGAVGNSGRSIEPHLHVHAQLASARAFDATPLPLWIDGRFMVRGSRLDTRGSRAEDPPDALDPALTADGPTGAR
jgi:hypothetical protein